MCCLRNPSHRMWSGLGYVLTGLGLFVVAGVVAKVRLAMSSIGRSDLEAKLREIQEAIDETSEQAKNAGVVIAIAVVVVIFIAFLLGRRKGKKGRARVEVYRI